MLRSLLACLVAAAVVSPALAIDAMRKSEFDTLITLHAKANGVPATLVHRVVVRESRYNPGAVGRGGAMGLMQIKHPTARSMGYLGAPSGLLDAETNLTYAVRYLAGAYRVAGGNPDRAVSFYARGYYYEAKRRGLTGMLKSPNPMLQTVATTPMPAPATAQHPAVAAPAPDRSALVGSRVLRESAR